MDGYSVLVWREKQRMPISGGNSCLLCNYYSQNNNSNDRKLMLTVLRWSRVEIYLLNEKVIFFFFTSEEAINLLCGVIKLALFCEC